MSRKEFSLRDLLAAVSFLALFVVPIRIFAGDLIFAQSIDGRSICGPNTLTVINITKSGCTFDKAKSVSTRSLTK